MAATDTIQKVVQIVFESIDKVGEKASSITKTMTQPFKSMNTHTERGTAKMKRFRYEFLGTMFAGMGLARVFGSYITNVAQMFGIFDLINTMFTVTLIPVFKVLLPIFLYIFKLFMDLPAPVKAWFGWMILILFVLGTIAATVSAIVLGLVSIGAAAGLGTALVVAAKIGLVLLGVVVLIGIAVAAIMYFWEDIVKLMKAAYNMQAGIQNFALSSLGFNQRVPMMAQGGLVTRPTIAMIGEKGPEAVVPLGHGGAGAMSPTINVYANVANNLDIHLLARKVFDELQMLQTSAYGAR